MPTKKTNSTPKAPAPIEIDPKSIKGRVLKKVETYMRRHKLTDSALSKELSGGRNHKIIARLRAGNDLLVSNLQDMLDYVEAERK